MKHLNNYPSNERGIGWRPKYKIGDFVRVINDNYSPGDWRSEPYEIENVRWAAQEYYLNTFDGRHIWRKEKNLQLVPDHEVAAIKYNL